MTTAYLALGSNLGDRAATLELARRRLAELGVSVLAASTVVETEPVGPAEQPRFLNQVIRVQAQVPPAELLALVKRIEREAGRRAGGPRWGPRELDIDIITYGDVVIDSPGLTIPHPRAGDRDFVLLPLAELDPGLAEDLRRG